MKGTPLRYGEFVVYPELCGLSSEELIERSRGNSFFYVASIPVVKWNLLVVYHNGTLVYSRPKYRLHRSESGLKQGRPPEVVEVNGRRVLFLICYELLFPRDYLGLREQQVDVIIHLVGQPMFDEDQREGWYALHEVLVELFDCPVVSCCGGASQSRLNLTHIVLPDLPIERDRQGERLNIKILRRLRRLFSSIEFHRG